MSRFETKVAKETFQCNSCLDVIKPGARVFRVGGINPLVDSGVECWSCCWACATEAAERAVGDYPDPPDDRYDMDEP